VGYNTLSANISGANATAFGSECMAANVSGAYNAAFGQLALSGSLTGNYNVAMGQSALLVANGASYNTCIGGGSGSSVTSGASNVLIGKDAGVTTTALTTGTENTIVGSFCYTSAADSASAFGLGYNLACEGGYTTVGTGASDIRAANGVATWATVSDERVKKDIEDATVGLEFINDLRPVTFNYRNKGDLPKEFRGYEEGSTEAYRNSKTQHGFIAQEVKAAIDKHSDVKDGFSMWDDDDPAGQQRVGETAVVPMLVKAIQELSAKVEDLEKQLNNNKE
jgi:hypothetical protein